jgi:dTDP-4-amino-4,6-dideoxygalactose transaminase
MELQGLSMAKHVQSDRVPWADPESDIASIREEILAAVAQVLDRGEYILGPLLTNFEQDLPSRLGVTAALGVASGTDALALALQALDVRERDEVITVSQVSLPRS